MDGSHARRWSWIRFRSSAQHVAWLHGQRTRTQSTSDEILCHIRQNRVRSYLDEISSFVHPKCIYGNRTNKIWWIEILIILSCCYYIFKWLAGCRNHSPNNIPPSSRNTYHGRDNKVGEILLIVWTLLAGSSSGWEWNMWGKIYVAKENVIGSSKRAEISMTTKL